MSRGLSITFFLLIFFFITATSFLRGDQCHTWFQKSKIDAHKKDCFSQRIAYKTGIDSAGCHFECNRFCEYPNRVWVFYANGMFNSFWEAQKNAAHFSSKFSTSIEQYPDLLPLLSNEENCKLAYNFSESFFIQLSEAFAQKAASETYNLIVPTENSNILNLLADFRLLD